MTDSKCKPVRSYSFWSSCRAYDFPNDVGHVAESYQSLSATVFLVRGGLDLEEKQTLLKIAK